MTAAITTLAPTEVDESEPGDLKLVSVTSILKAVGGNDALIYWSADETAKAAIEDHDIIGTWIEKGQIDQALEHLSKARFRPKTDRLTATALGTAVHSILEELATGNDDPDLTDAHPQVKPMARHLIEWWNFVKPTPIASELTVYSPTFGYAGSLDLICEIDGVPVICDLKTSADTHYKSGKERGPYPEQVGLQLAAYRFAEFAATWSPRRLEKQRGGRFYLLAEDERANSIPVPEVVAGVVLHVTPGWCRAYPITVDEQSYESFLHAIELYRWTNDDSKSILHDSLPYESTDVAQFLKAAASRVQPKRRSTRHTLPPTGVSLPNPEAII